VGGLHQRTCILAQSFAEMEILDADVIHLGPVGPDLVSSPGPAGCAAGRANLSNSLAMLS
jgi:hypothetical protein